MNVETRVINYLVDFTRDLRDVRLFTSDKSRNRISNMIEKLNVISDIINDNSIEEYERKQAFIFYFQEEMLRWSTFDNNIIRYLYIAKNNKERIIRNRDTLFTELYKLAEVYNTELKLNN